MNNSECNNEHRYNEMFDDLPIDQGGFGRHKCAGCAYEIGFEAGMRREEDFRINLDNLPDSQAGTVRHKSPHAAYAKGYFDGVIKSYE